MVAGNIKTITFEHADLSYSGACEISNRASDVRSGANIRIELDRVVDTTTAALARLVLLRRDLRRAGRDLRIAGLHGQPKELYEFNRMASLLPQN